MKSHDRIMYFKHGLNKIILSTAFNIMTHSYQFKAIYNMQRNMAVSNSQREKLLVCVKNKQTSSYDVNIYSKTIGQGDTFTHLMRLDNNLIR